MGCPAVPQLLLWKTWDSAKLCVLCAVTQRWQGHLRVPKLVLIAYVCRSGSPLSTHPASNALSAHMFPFFHTDSRGPHPQKWCQKTTLKTPFFSPGSMHRTEVNGKAVGDGDGEMWPCTVVLTLQLSTSSSGHGEEDKDFSGRFPVPQAENKAWSCPT